MYPSPENLYPSCWLGQYKMLSFQQHSIGMNIPSDPHVVWICLYHDHGFLSGAITDVMMPTDNHPDMSREDHRFASFLNWPGTPSPSLLADAGFYYTGVGNQVKCFSCGGTVSNWDSTMPDKVHRERFPFCALVNNREHTHQPWVPSMRTVRLAEEVMPDLFNSSGPAPNMMGMALLNNTTETEAATQRQRPRLAAASSRPSMASTGATQVSLWLYLWFEKAFILPLFPWRCSMLKACIRHGISGYFNSLAPERFEWNFI